MRDDSICVADFERIAAEKLDQGTAGYFFGGACDERTLADSVAAWHRWQLRPRMLTGCDGWATEAEVLGTDLKMPILIAPVAYQRLVAEDGELAMARAAAEVGTVMCLSTLATTRPAEVAEAAPGERRWFQLYCFRDAGVTRALMEEAVEAGFEAIVITVDAPRGGRRERDPRTGFKIPEGLGVPNVQARAWFRPRRDDRGDLRSDGSFAELGGPRACLRVQRAGFVKGVLTGEDSRSSTVPPVSSSPTMEVASSTASQPLLMRYQRWSRPSPVAGRFWSTEGSAEAPTWRLRWHWEPTPSWSGGRALGARRRRRGWSAPRARAAAR